SVSDLLCTPPATPQTHTPSLHDALPISPGSEPSARPEAAMTASIRRGMKPRPSDRVVTVSASFVRLLRKVWVFHRNNPVACSARSEEHTSELQSRFDLVCRLLLEKKNNE